MQEQPQPRPKMVLQMNDIKDALERKMSAVKLPTPAPKTYGSGSKGEVGKTLIPLKIKVRVAKSPLIKKMPSKEGLENAKEEPYSPGSTPKKLPEKKMLPKKNPAPKGLPPKKMAPPLPPIPSVVVAKEDNVEEENCKIGHKNEEEKLESHFAENPAQKLETKEFREIEGSEKVDSQIADLRKENAELRKIATELRLRLKMKECSNEFHCNGKVAWMEVRESGEYKVVAIGANSKKSDLQDCLCLGGRGAYIECRLTLKKGDLLEVLVGQEGK